MNNDLERTIFLLLLAGGLAGIIIWDKSKEKQALEKEKLKNLKEEHSRKSDSLYNFYINNKDSYKDWDKVFNLYLTKQDSLDSVYRDIFTIK